MDTLTEITRVKETMVRLELIAERIGPALAVATEYEAEAILQLLDGIARRRLVQELAARYDVDDT